MSPSTRLLAGTAHAHRADLASHLSLHGPLTLPERRDVEAWSAQLLDEIRLAGLTGRGGGGFPTATKLASIPRSRRATHLVINVMEGEPAAQKDSVLAAFAPHLIVDGAEVLARLVRAGSVTLAVARDNPHAARSLTDAVLERHSRASTSVPISVEQLPSRYVGGEEAGLVRWLDGGPAMPTFRASKPARLEIRGRTSIVDNAETAASIALIARHGGAWFANVGVGGVGGTKLVTLSGSVADPGVFEVALGTRLGEIVDLATPTSQVQAVLLGGYGGTFVPAQALEAPYSAEGLKAFGSSVGAGVVLVFGSACCGVAETARIARWMANESAGQCGPCAFGLPALADDLEALAAGRPDRNLERRLRERLGVIRGRGACGHPDGVVRMIASALEVFHGDVRAHLGGRPCAHLSKPTMLSLPNQDGPLEWR